MRKIFIALSALLALATACTVEPLPQVKEEAKGKFTIIASTGSETKTEITDKGKVSWQESDAIDIYDGQFNKFSFDGLDENGNGIFKGDLGNAEGMLLAVYPSGIGSEVAGRRLSVVLPGSYEYDGENTHTPMLSSRVKMDQTTARVSFKHLGGLIKITYDNVPEEAVEFVFSATKQISGRFQIEDYMAENVVIVSSETETDDDKTVRYPIGEDHPSKMTFYVPVPTGTFGFNIAILDSEGVAIEGSSKKKSSISIERGAYFNIPTITLPIIEKDGYKRITSLSEFESGDYVIVAHVEQENSFNIKGDFALPNTLTIEGNGKIKASGDVSAKIKNNLISVEDGEPYKLLISGSTDNLTVSNGEKSLAYKSTTELTYGGTNTNTAWVLSKNDGVGGTFILTNKSTTIGEEPKARALLLQLYSNSTTKTMVFGAYDVKTNVNAKDYSSIELYKRVYGESPIEHKAYFSVNGSVDESLTRTVNQGTKIEFPANPSVSGGTFQGWIKYAIDGVQDDAPSMIDTNEEKMGGEDVTYYAVFTPSNLERTSTWAISGVDTPASGGYNVNTTLRTSSVIPQSETGVWTAVASNSYAGTSSGKAQLGSGSYKFAGTISLSGSSIPSNASITQINMVATSSATDANPYTIKASVAGQPYGIDQSLSSGNPNCQWSGVGTGSNIVLTTSCGYNKNIIISSISVKYKVGVVGYCTTLPETDEPGIIVSSIAVKTNPSKTTYTEGETFSPAGLVITVTYSDTVTEDISYYGHEADFTFLPSLSSELKASDNKIQITYKGQNCDLPITVISGLIPSNKYKWFETPTIYDANDDGRNDQDLTQYYSSHSFSLNGKQYRNFTLCYSKTHLCPLWVSAPRHICYTGTQTRTEAYKADPNIPVDIQYVSKNVSQGYSKGHMLGSAARTCSEEANKQVFYYTNIAPQLIEGFNTGGGGWNYLEDWVDKQVCTDTLYQVVGCHFKEFTDGYGHTVSPQTLSFGGKTDVSVPTMFYYVLLRTKSGTSGKAVDKCSATELKCAAFVRSHTSDLKGQKVTSSEMMSVSDLEKITGVNYFPNVPNAPKNSYSPSDWGL